MGWIFLREKPGHGIQRLFLWLGEGRGTEYSFFFAMGSGKRAHDLGLCFYFLAVLVSLILSVSLMVWFFLSFSGFEPL